MSAPLRLPIRVLVKGPSTVCWMSWMGGPRTDFIFPRVIEERFCAEGRPADVRAVTMPSLQAKTILADWQEEVLGFSPDVIALTYGQQEVIHLFLPRWLERHANSERARPRPLSRLYRARVLRPTWKLLTRLQARLDQRWPSSLRARSRRYVVATLEQYIGKVQRIGSPMVLVMEFLAPAQRQSDWFPGMAARLELMNAELRAMVERIDLPHVRWFTLTDLVNELYDGSVDLATPDGFHYTPELHRAIGNKMASVIAEWAETQPHLATPGADAESAAEQARTTTGRTTS